MVRFVRNLALVTTIIGSLVGPSEVALAEFPACDSRFRFSWDEGAVAGYFSARTDVPCSLHVFMRGNTVLTSIRIDSPPKHGKASVSGTAIDFKPQAGFRGEDSMKVRYFGKAGAKGTSREATVTFAITIY